MMKKRLYILAVLLLSISVVSATEQPQATQMGNLAALARYIPADAPLFAFLQTDAAAFNEWEELRQLLQKNLPPNTQLTSVDSLLDVFFTSLLTFQPVPTFEASMRPWLGDAIGLFVRGPEPLPGTPPITAVSSIIITVRDRTRAEEFLRNLFAAAIADGDVEFRTEPDNTSLYIVPNFAYYLLRDDVLIIGLPISGDIETVTVEFSPSLMESEQFQAALGAMPTSDYALVAYADFERMQQILLDLQSQSTSITNQILWDSLAQLGQGMVGFTRNGEQTLLMDMAFTAPGKTPNPLDTRFLTRLPDYTLLVWQGTELGILLDYGLQGFEKLDEVQALAMPNLESDFRFRHISTFIRQWFQGIFGLSLDNTLAAMNGNFSLFFGGYFNSADDWGATGGLIIENTNPEITARLVAETGRFFTEMFSTVIERNGMFVWPIHETIDFDWTAPVALGYDENVVALSDEYTVQNAITPIDDNLTTNPRFELAQQVFLPDMETLFFADLETLTSHVNSLVELYPSLARNNDVQSLRQLLALFDSASMTLAYQTESLTLRFALTISE